MVIYVFKKQEDASGEIGHFCHCLIKIMLTKKRNLGEKEGQKTEKGYEKTTFRTLFFVKAITLPCKSIAFSSSFDRVFRPR